MPSAASRSRSRSGTISHRRARSTPASSRASNENQIYRIDHFLGKETVQNIMTARFANTMIEAAVEQRLRSTTSRSPPPRRSTSARAAGSTTPTGALRDMVPNHLFQLLAMVGMEPPNGFDAEAIRDEKGKVLKAVRVYSPEEAAASGVRGRYGAGKVGDHAGRRPIARPTVVDPDSRTETYVALKLMVDTWRWAGVPFYLRTGKAMAVRDTEVVVSLQARALRRCSATPPSTGCLPNRLVIQVQPDEGLSMDIVIKRPGLEVDTAPVSLDFRYADHFQISAPHRLRDAALRPVHRRPDAVPARRRDRGGLGGGAAVPRPVGQGGRARTLRGRQPRPRRRGGADRARRPRMAFDRAAGAELMTRPSWV